MCVPKAKPIMKAINTNQRSAPALSASFHQRNTAQKVNAVKKELIAYTSDSTALNQKLSINVLVKAATVPAPNTNNNLLLLSSSTIRSAK